VPEHAPERRLDHVAKVQSILRAHHPDQHDSIFATVAVLIGSPESTDAELKSMYVRKDHRRAGWARKLLDIAKHHARAKKCIHLYAWSDTRFIHAHKMYLNAGFQPCGQRDIEDSNNSTELGFILNL
jgi:GNAT superfamily N-acetyltransferase